MIACRAIAGNIRAGCWVESGTYRPRRCTGEDCWPVTHTDVSGHISSTRCRIGSAITAPGHRGPAGESLGLAEDEHVGVHRLVAGNPVAGPGRLAGGLD